MPLNPSGFIKTLRGITPSPHYALAVSGGRDSMALVALAAKAQKLKNAPRFSVLSVNHGLRTAAADEVRQVAQICATLDLAHYTLKAKQALPKTGVQQAARHLRYGLMAQWCAHHKAGALVVAHHLQDQAETILMRLAHNSGIAGLGGMTARQTLATPYGDIILVRPFLAHAREDLEAVVRRAKLLWSDDPTNTDTQYERVRWRQLLPQLEEAGLSAQVLTALAAQCQVVSAGVNAQAAQWLADYAAYNPYGFFEIDRPAFAIIAPSLQKRIVQGLVQWLGGGDYAPASSQVEGLLAALDTKPPPQKLYGAMTFGGCLLRWQSRYLFIGCEAAHIDCTRDRRFTIKEKRGLTLAPLGAKGAQTLREQNISLPKIPAAYVQALPAFFDEQGKFIACPPLEGERALKKQINFIDVLTKNYM
ncbi:MAG: tRNA lysidine(34) synthetase TilS [Alphaproteobacteria bacterium]|nr:tRNA lysidine(34) synthetase TilS [Alphaproteobacteria bacterium]